MFEKSGHFYIRYYTTVDGARKQKAELLCKRDDKHHSTSCKPVKLLRDKFMLKVNSEADKSRSSAKVVQFWTATYLPFAEKNLRTSTVDSYRDLWERHLEPHFGSAQLSEYRASTATAFLTSLASKLGRNSLNHVRSLMSGIFSHATALGHLEHNPMRDAKVLGKTKAPGNTPHYSVEELEAIVSALIDAPEAQLVMALAGYMGLRPSEITGLQWEDFANEELHIRRAVTRGVIGPTKTEESVASLPLVSSVKEALERWRAKSAAPSKGWVFPNRSGSPMDIRELCRRRIRPILTLKNIPWKGLYAGRRTAATVLTQLTGNPIAASQLLRHRNISVTMSAYIKADRSALANGLRILEQRTANRV
jgi:integrase